MDEQYKMVHSKAARRTRLEHHKKLLKNKEDNTVEKEITKLKHMLEHERTLTSQKVEELQKTKIICRMREKVIIWKNLENCASCLQENSFLFDTGIHSHNSFKGKPEDLDVLASRKGSMIQSETKYEYDTDYLNVSEVKEVNLVKSKENEKKKEILQKISNIEKEFSKRKVKLIWNTWRAKTQLRKGRKKEKNLIRVKVDSFLLKLRKGDTDFVREKKIKSKNILYDRKEEELRKLVEDVKASQKEAYNKLQMLSSSQRTVGNSKVLQNMEKRREERLKRKREIQEKRGKIEREKKRAQELLEEEMKKRQEENKRKQIRDLKEKRRLDEERKAEEKRKREKQKANAEIAKNNCRLFLIRNWGLRPWLELMERRKRQWILAEEHFRRQLSEKAFKSWKANAELRAKFKARMADELHQRKLQRFCFRVWLDFYEGKRKQEQVAVDWNELKLVEKLFSKWLQFTQMQQLDHLRKTDLAHFLYERKLRMKYLKIWKNYPELKRQEMAKENRKQKWREKVMEILPDYRPIDAFGATINART